MAKLENGGVSWKSLRHKLGDMPRLTVVEVAINKALIGRYVDKIEYLTNSRARITKISWPWFRVTFTRRAELEGVRLPARFGLGYEDYDCDLKHYYIIPFNLIVAFSRYALMQIRWKLPKRFKPDLDKLRYECYIAGKEAANAFVDTYREYWRNQGYRDGFQVGYNKALDVMLAQLNQNKDG